MLSDTSSILSECMDSFTQSEDFKSLLGTQKDLGQLEDIGELLLSRCHLQFVQMVFCKVVAGDVYFVMSLSCFNFCFGGRCLFETISIRLHRDRHLCVKYVAACTLLMSQLLLYVICIGQSNCPMAVSISVNVFCTYFK